MLNTLTAWLTPARRRAIYGALFALGMVLVAVGVVTESGVTGWVGLVDAILSVAALALASWKAKRADWTAVYGVLAVAAAAFKAVGLWSDWADAHVMSILAALTAAAPLLAAAIRTSPVTPTGEPEQEYDARHAATDVATIYGTGVDPGDWSKHQYPRL